MPKGYEKIRDKLIRKGYSRKKAQELAAKIWNKYAKKAGKPTVGRGRR